MKKASFSGLALTIVLAVAFAMLMPLPATAQTANSVVQTLGVDPTVTYADGTLYYTVTLTNQNIPGANNATVDLTFYPPGPTGAVDYGSPIVLDTDRFIAVGDTVSYNYDGSGGANARPGLEVDLGVIPLDPGVTLVYGASAIHADYVHDPPYWADDEKNIPAQVIYPSIEILKLVDCNDDGVYSKEETTFGPSDDADWYVNVTNTGDSPVHSITVSDSNGHDFGAPFDLVNNGDYQEFYYTTIITKTTTNTATAGGQDELGGAVTAGPVSATNNIWREVGGTVLPVNKLMLIAPWVVLVGALGVMTLFMIRKKRRA